MSHRLLAIALIVVHALLVPGCSAIEGKTTPIAATSRPNVIVIITDDQRWNALGCAGHPSLRTPHLDRLASEGIHFRNAFCTTSLCSPSRASILSGLYAHAHGVKNNFTEYPEALESFPRRLQEAGYETAYIGKWHMGEGNDAPRPGFDWFVTHKGQGKYFDTEFAIQGERRVLPGYYTNVVTDLALDWVRKPRTKPFLLMLGHKASHSFYVPEPKYANTFDAVDVRYPESAFDLAGKPQWVRDRLTTWHGIYGPLFEFRKDFPDTRPEGVAAFASMVRSYWSTILSVDDSVGRIRAALEELGVLDDTIIIFLSDNGILEGEHGMVDKRTMHEPSIRIPLIVRYPRRVPPAAARKVDEMVLTLDIAPTILDLCGSQPITKTHGRSFAPLLDRKTVDWRKSWYYEYDYEKQFPYTPNVRGVRTDRWKYVRYPHGDGGPDRHRAELYDLAADPDERQNLIDEPEQAATITELQAELARLIRESGVEKDSMPIDEGIKSELPEASIR
jgi:arylsulfatase A-like enzyme